MNAPRKSPSQIAREALKVLSGRGLAPTPANYSALYHEIAATPMGNGFPEAPLKELAESLPAQRQGERDALASLDAAIAHQSWKEVREALIAYARVSRGPADARRAPTAELKPADAPAGAARPTGATIEALLRLLESLLPLVEDEEKRLSGRLADVKAALKDGEAGNADAVARIALLHDQALVAAEEQAEVRGALLKLLHLILENIAQLSLDDRWLEGQVEALLAALAPPLRLRQLDAVEARVRDVMRRQAKSRERVLAARDEMRSMLATFIDRLASIGASSDVHREHLEHCARRIGEVKSIEDLAPLLNDVIATTQDIALETGKARDEMRDLQDRVRDSQVELEKLHRDLDHASAQARHDALTDTLNRKGLDEALEAEVGRMRHQGSRLSLAMLDIDDFKRLNDSRGHETGDAALVHLAKVARGCLRATDSLARFGGEEFAFLLPDTTQAEGIEVMVRLQRELTRDIFMHGADRVLITFSAGVVELEAGESGIHALNRADRAMYLAKRAGKNRVVGG